MTDIHVIVLSMLFESLSRDVSVIIRISVTSSQESCERACHVANCFPL